MIRKDCSKDKTENEELRALKERKKQERKIRLDKKHRSSAWCEEHALAKAIAAAKVPEKGKRDSKRENIDGTLDLSQRMEVTNPSFIRQVQATIFPKVSILGAGEKLSALQKEDITAEERAAMITFDKIYRPFVYKVLVTAPEKGGLGFKYRHLYNSQTYRYKVPYRGEISGEEVYSEVWTRLFGADGNKPALLNFDVAKERVGRGAFRLYLRLVVKSVYYDLTRRDTMILKDIHGNTIYKTDPHTKKYLYDKNGAKIPVRVPRSISPDDAVLEKELSGIRAKDHAKRVEKTAFQQRISLKYLAYLYVHDTQLFKDGWFYKASKDIFENGVLKDEVMQGCLERGEIKKRASFDTALSRFREAIDKKAAELSRVIFAVEDAKMLSAHELIDREWERTAKRFGMSRVKDVRLRVMAAMVEAFEVDSCTL